MYYLVLGDFGDINLKRSYTDYADSERMWIQFENLLSHLYFLGATFITQIMIFNMLISIMSDTQGRHNDMIVESSMRQRLRLQTEFSHQDVFYGKLCKCACFTSCCRKNARSADTKSKEGQEALSYLFVIEPRDDDDEGEPEAAQGAGSE